MRLAVLSFLAAIAAAPLAVADEASQNKRVLVLDVKPVDADKDDVAGVPAVIEKELARHVGFAVISREKLAQSVQAAGGKDAAGCAEDPACLSKVAQDLKADLLIAGSLEKKKKGFLLTLRRIEASNPKGGTTNSESMKRIGSLPMNVALVLDRLFKWNDDAPIPPPEFDLPPEEESAAAPPPAAPKPADASRARRVAFFGVKAEKGIDDDEVERLPATIVKEIGKRQGFEAVELDALKASIEKAGGKDGFACASDKACATRAAESVHADLVLTARVEKSRGKYVLRLDTSEPGGAKAATASESMKRVSSLPLNVPLCLDNLLR